MIIYIYIYIYIGLYIYIYIGLYVKYPLFLYHFNVTFFSDRFSKNPQSIEFHENLSSGSRVLFGRTDGQTNNGTHTTKLIVAFRSFVNAPKNTPHHLEKANQLKSFKAVVVESVNYMKPTSTLCGQRKNSLELKQVVYILAIMF